MRKTVLAAIIAGIGTLGAAAGSARVPVLRQIDLPHNYYFREMYLPQLTNSPQYPVFSPDGRDLVYSMAGSLWRQLNEELAEMASPAGGDVDTGGGD